MKVIILFLVLLVQFIANSQTEHESKLYHKSNIWLVEPIQVSSTTESTLAGSINLPQYNIIDKKSQVFIILFDSINHYADTLDASIVDLDKNKKSDIVSFSLSGEFKPSGESIQYYLLWNAEVIADLNYSVQKGDTIHLETKIFKDPKNPDRKNLTTYGYKHEVQSNRKNIDKYFLIFDKRKHGQFTSSYLNSYAIETSQYFLGNKHGKEVIMENADEVDRINNWRFGVLHGESQNWYKGVLVSSILYSDGKRNGWSVTWQDNGGIRDSTFYSNDIKTGKQVEYWKSGVKSKEFFNKDNLIEGEYNSYHENGKTAWQGMYEKNKKQGFWYHYNENGGLKSFESYKNGVSNKDKTEFSNGYIFKSERAHYVPYSYPEYASYFIVIDSCQNLREVIDKTDSLVPLFKNFQIKYIKPNQYKGVLKSDYYSILLVSDYTYYVKDFKEKLQTTDFANANGPMVKISSKGITQLNYDRLDTRDSYGNKQDLILIYQSQEDMDNYEGEDWGWFVNDVGEALSNSNETFIWGDLSDYLNENEIKRIVLRQQMEGFGYFLYKGETGEMQFLSHDMPSSIIYGINEFFGTEIEME